MKKIDSEISKKEELNNLKDEKIAQRKVEQKNSSILSKIIAMSAIILVAGVVILLVNGSKEGNIKSNAKISLDKIVEKSDLETANITYNVIAKKCKNEEECDLKSNNIADFKYVVSCKGTITAGIDFSKIKIEQIDKEKKLIITMPEATLKGEPTIGSTKFLNGTDISANELPEARKLCQETVKEKSEKDNKLLPAAKEQARVVLEEFYTQWIKAYDSDYKVVVK